MLQYHYHSLPTTESGNLARAIIKMMLHKKHLSLTKMVSELNKQYPNEATTVQNISNKLSRDTIRLTEFVEMARVCGFEICLRELTTQNMQIADAQIMNCGKQAASSNRELKTKVVIESIISFNTEEDKNSYDAYSNTIRFGDDIFDKAADVIHGSIINANGDQAMYETETIYNVVK